jgi:hypothetical protein
MLGAMSNSDTRIEHPQNLACILDVTRAIKKQQINNSR